jgi:hypothetical protein
MKKHINSVKIAAAALGLLLLAACVNPLGPPRDKGRAEIAGGKGLVLIGAGAGAARTALPAAVFDHYEYLFAKDGGTPEALTPSDGGGEEARFELEPGAWTVTLNAYAGEGDDTLAATGTAEFTVILQEETTVTVALNPIVREGSGVLNYTLTYPDGATIESFTLTRLAGTDETDLMTGATETVTAMKTLTGSRESVGSGYYLARAALKKDNITVDKTEVVHIYRSMTTSLSLEFTANDFKALLVVNSADSGPGSLRRVLTDAPSGATILIELPAEDRVITLTSGPLVISGKNFTILGNGATLTQRGNDRLLTIEGTGTATISRLHFKGGRATGTGTAGAGGAITKAASTLTLESCIFSDNQAAAAGGAINNTGSTAATLIIRGSTFYGNRAGTSGGALNGPVTLTGNLFWGNTARTSNSVANGTLVTSLGFNVSDLPGGAANSGWIFDSSDKQAASLSLSPVSFKPLAGGGALSVITVIPEGYPAADFNGRPMPEGYAAAGAVQTQAQGSGYVLDYAAQGPGAVSVPAGTVNEDGMASGSVTLTAQEISGGAFRHWTVDGVKQEGQSNVLTLPINGHKMVRAVFYVNVSAAGDSGTGSLRDALLNAGEGGGVILPQGGLITLSDNLTHQASVVIEGNGAKLNLNGYHLVISGVFTEVVIDRLHITGGRTAGITNGGGGAIQNAGTLTLTSCIFSDNQIFPAATNARGGAVFNSGTLSVLGCTFYENKALLGQGGAIFNSTAGTLTLRGNLFWGNDANSGKAAGGTVAVKEFNVSDLPSGAANSGWGFGPGDTQASSLPISFVTYKPFEGGDALGVVTARPAGYPAADFYGDEVPAQNASAGAAQLAIPAAGFVLDYSALGPGSISLPSGAVDANGMASGSVELTAAPNANGEFRYWSITSGGVVSAETDNPYVLSLNTHTIVRAVFYNKVSTTADSGAGSLREALEAAPAGVTLPEGETITLISPLEITKSLVIEGNGATLTQTAFTPGPATQLLRINGTASTEVRIRRLHFKGGRTMAAGTAYAEGGAIRNSLATLTLESCIFSDNQANESLSYGGALYTSGPVTVSGCTFYKNLALGGGGVIYKTSGTFAVTLRGNIFWGNTDNTNYYPIVRNAGSGTVASAGFNVFDAAFGTGSGQSGWAAHADDVANAALPLSPVSFKPAYNGDAKNKIAVPPADYPAEDFYGDPIGTPAAAGAIQDLTAQGWILAGYAAQGPGEVSITSGTVDTDGIVTGSGIVTLEAEPDAGKIFAWWIVNGVRQPEQGTPEELVLTLPAHSEVLAVFGTVHTVDSPLSTGAGTLHEAITNSEDGDRIELQGQTIVLEAALPAISKSIDIEGNGSTLTSRGSDFTLDNSYMRPLLTIDGDDVRIRRLHFKSNRTRQYAALNWSGKTLIVESCIFSDNQQGLNYGIVNLRGSDARFSGCTFYGNGAPNGGAAFLLGSAATTLAMRGNLFFGNTAPNATTYGVLLATVAGTLQNGGGNVSDIAYGTSTGQAGWVADGTDVSAPTQHFGFSTFKPFHDSPALNALSTRPADYPLKDFYGDDILGTNVTAGAVQTASASGYSVDYAAQGPGRVEVTGGTLDEDGITNDPTVTLTAYDTANAEFRYWRVISGGVTDTSQTSNSLTLTMNANKIVRAVFYTRVTTTNNTGAGSLREALTNVADGGGIIFPPEATISISAALPVISGNIVIEGMGATLTTTGSATTQLSTAAGATVRISRLHFKGRGSYVQGPAVFNRGNLTLESCIFSDNWGSGATTTYGYGGAIYSIGTAAAPSVLTVWGCTFYNNRVNYSSSAGAIYRGNYTTLTLGGNLFSGNSGSSTSYWSTVYPGNTTGTTTTSKGYNVVDKLGGTTTQSTQSGWVFDPADSTLVVSFVDTGAGNFRPLSTMPLSLITGPVSTIDANFPTTYFDGTARPAANSVPGAMPKQ